MNKYELKTILLSGSLLGVFLFAVLYNSFSRKIDVPTCVPYSGSFQKSHIKQIDDSTFEVYLVARMWAFDPDEITIPIGSTVDFYLTSADVVHGFFIERKAVNLMAVPGAVNKTTIRFDDYGTYTMLCHEYCGSGHQNMMGKIIVTNKK
jgi:cytochrome c oxidase subunit 2